MWYALYEKSTGRLHSIGTLLGDYDLSKYELKQYNRVIDFGTEMWNESIKDFEPRPKKVMKNIVDEITDDSRLAIPSSEKNKLKVILEEKLNQAGYEKEY